MVKMAQKQKNKITFIIQTFKVGTIKVVLFFKYDAVLAMLLKFLAISCIFHLKSKKWPIYGLRGKILKK